MGTAKIVIPNWKRRRCLSIFPTDLLLKIFGYLSVLDWLSVRAVCKCWRDAFVEFQSKIPQSEEMPWFLLLRNKDLLHEQSVYYAPPLYTTGKLGNLFTKRIFTLNIPELCGTQFLLSRHGWLLLFSSSSPTASSSLFFFNPFSRARIDLPLMDISKLSSPAFEISSAPTSAECTVLAISCLGKNGFRISLCHRGENVWTSRVLRSKSEFGSVSNAVFVKEGFFYCLHRRGFISVVDPRNFTWKAFALLEGMGPLDHWPLVSYTMKQDDQVSLFIHSSLGYELVLKEPLKLNPQKNWSANFDLIERNELKIRVFLREEILKVQHQLKLSSFNIHAWCGTSLCKNKRKNCESQMTGFNWHRFRSFVDDRSHVCFEARNGRTCPFRKEEDGLDSCSTKVAWFEPIWVNDHSTDLVWSREDSM